jgi:hypothetical protein
VNISILKAVLEGLQPHFVRLEGEKVYYRASNLGEAKTVLKELRLIKKSLSVLRRDVAASQKHCSQSGRHSNELVPLEEGKLAII